MRHFQHRFHSARDIEIHYHRWLPSGGAQRRLLVLHGAGEHGGWYEELAEAATACGWMVIAPDLRGHGLSSGQRGHVERFDDYLDDLERLVTSFEGGASDQQPDPRTAPPLAVLGHSMGGLLAIRLAQTRRIQSDALVLCSPLLGLAHPVGWFWAAAARLLNATVPRASVSTGIRAEDSTRDPEVRACRRADELRHTRVTARWFREMNATVDAAFRQAGELRVPLLLLQAGDERVTSADASRRFFEQVGSRDKSFRLFEGHLHELLGEPDRAEITAELLGWLDARVPMTRKKAKGKK